MSLTGRRFRALHKCVQMQREAFMLLMEEHRIHRNSQKDLFRVIDDYCYRAKNLYNAVNYLIRQCGRIHRKLQSGEALEDWEREMADQVNEGIRLYHAGRPAGVKISCVDEKNALAADAYFLSWYLKASPEYKAMPYATCSQICIQELCRSWKSFYQAASAWRKHPERFAGFPRKPGCLDPKEGRGWLVITSQNFHLEEDGRIRMPGFLREIHIKTGQKAVRQIRVRTDGNAIRILLVYEKEECTAASSRGTAVMGIDLGVDNLITAVWNTEQPPVILNGRTLKSINQYYNKERARLQAAAKKGNKKEKTKRVSRLTEKRNRKVKDYLHKASRKIVELAKAAETGVMIIGNNKGWKQKVNLGNRTNQDFVSIPYRKLIEMICYKAALAGIEVRIVNESYSSGTSYLDGEMPEKEYYDRSRRIHRGLFRSNGGITINADVNAAYQIMKAGGVIPPGLKVHETVARLKVA